MLRLADGVWAEEVDQDGETRIYRKPPCFKSNTYLIDRIMGKPTEIKEVATNTEDITIRVIETTSTDARIDDSDS